MDMRWAAAFLLCASVATSHAQNALPRLDQRNAVPKTQVLVLGSMHLREAPKSFRPTMLEPLLARLAAYRPTIITIEQLSGETCDLMARYPAVYDPQDVTTYCHDTSAARAATGLDIPAATAEVKRTLARWPASPTPAQRRHLAALFLAAGDDTSAAVQWMRLPKSERHAGDGLDEKLVADIEARSTRNNESVLIAATLAARLGLERVYPVDDHAGDNVPIDDPKAYGTAVQAAWDTAKAMRQPVLDKEDAMLASGNLLDAYRHINTPESLTVLNRSDFGAAIADPSPKHYGQLYVAGWETRNLRMAANIRFAFALTPGTRVLTIVGSMHKPWLDSLLGQMQGVDIVDAESTLR